MKLPGNFAFPGNFQEYEVKKKSIYSLVSALISIFIIIKCWPQTLFWPHSRDVGEFRIYSEFPIVDQISPILQAAKVYRARSSLAGPMTQQKVYLTTGGWRWHLLALRSNGAFAISSPFFENIVVNSSSIEKNEVRTGRSIGGIRPLDRVLAHELTHGVLREHFGVFQMLGEPNWLTEGYCDYVADNSSLTAMDVKKLKQRGEAHPAIPYFEGRMRIAGLIERKKMTVDELFSNF